MSAFGPFASALHMSAFGCKADMGKLYSTPANLGTAPGTVHSILSTDFFFGQLAVNSSS
jgi:hypothetical protein